MRPSVVADPDRKGKVESGIGHAQKTPLHGQRFERLEQAQTYLDRWETHWADTRIHGTTKRQVAAMFTEERPALQALPVEPFRYYRFGVENAPGTLFDVFLFSKASRSSTARGEPLIQTPALEQAPVVSPGGRYVAYESNASGRSEIYVRPFPQVNSGLWKVSTAGGTQPAWAPTGRELFYIDPSKMLMAVPVESAGATFSNGNPIKIFSTKDTINAYDVAPDGKRFLIINENATDDATRARAGIQRRPPPSDSGSSGGHDDLRLVPSSICQIFDRRNCQIFNRRCQ
jgi:hypothetical protein